VANKKRPEASELLAKIKKMERTDFSDQSIWKPQDGESLVGELVRVQHLNTQFGEKMVLTIVNVETTQNIKVFCNSVLEGQVTELRAREGDVVGIKHFGMKGKYRDYGLTILERADASPDGDNIPF
jgi:hypothetical protein